jgi:hypothetical protein
MTAGAKGPAIRVALRVRAEQPGGIIARGY